jgi:hypothetical protein
VFSLMTRELYTPAVGDILDDLGFTHQFLPQPIQPMREEMKLAGRAMPVLMIDVYGKQRRTPRRRAPSLGCGRRGTPRIRFGRDRRSWRRGNLRRTSTGLALAN